MKKLSLLVASAFVLFAFKPIDTATWTVDRMHSRMGFIINHLGVNDILGSFDTYDCKISTSKADFSDATIEMTADVNSINTGAEKRDSHLKSPDFFDATQFGTITFKSKSVKKVDDKTITVKGDLTMHGVTKEVELKLVHKETVNPMSKKDLAGIAITGTIKRSDFGIGAKFPAPMLSDEVMLDAHGEFGKN
ncbi:MAG TPA: YceI family protein [Bacteroidia bacterium]|jgi:polyisoprenoid-binding protein YceI|nr:YceI family protein [Bacteroidia bacterium]